MYMYYYSIAYTILITKKTRRILMKDGISSPPESFMIINMIVLLTTKRMIKDDITRRQDTVVTRDALKMVICTQDQVPHPWKDAGMASL